MFGAFQDYLNAITFCFLCHFVRDALEGKNFDITKVEVALGFSLTDSGVETDLVDGAQCCAAQGQLYPHVLLYPIEFLRVQVYLELAFRAALRVGNVVAHRCLFACDLTSFSHGCNLFLFRCEYYK